MLYVAKAMKIQFDRVFEDKHKSYAKTGRKNGLTV